MVQCPSFLVTRRSFPVAQTGFCGYSTLVSSMASYKSIPPLHVLRSILRRLKTKTDLVGDSSLPTRTFVVQQYRAAQSAPLDKANKLRKIAYEYSMLRHDLKERQILYDLDTGAEVKLSPKEMSRRAAARAGLLLPDLNPNL